MTTRFTLPIALLACVQAASAGISQPDCEVLASWADTFTPPAGRTGPAAIPEVFRTEAFAEMFGKTLDAWDGQDFRTLDNYMKDCQRQLYKQHRHKALQINDVRRHLPPIQRAVEQAAEEARRSRDVSAQPTEDLRRTRKTVDRGRDDPPAEPPRQPQGDVNRTPEPARQAAAEPPPQGTQVNGGQQEARAALADQMASTYESLQGFRFAEPGDLGRFLRQLQGLGRVLADPRNADAAAKSGVKREDLTALYEQRFLTAVDELLPAFRRYLEGLPETDVGLKSAKGAVSKATGVRYSDDIMADYIAAAEQRAGEIQRVVDRTAAAERHAREHMDVGDRLDALVQGERVSLARLGKLAPGMSTAKVIADLNGAWGYQEHANLSLEARFAPPPGALNRFKAERRDGGQMTLREMDDSVGQLEFVEHYQAKMEPDAIHQRLVERFGQPDMEQVIERGVVWVWQQGGRRLEVRLENQADVIMQAAGFRSRLALALWNTEYEDYLKEASKRCSRIRKMPRSERSMDDASFFMKHKCPMIGDEPLAPGLAI